MTTETTIDRSMLPSDAKINWLVREGILTAEYPRSAPLTMINRLIREYFPGGVSGFTAAYEACTAPFWHKDLPEVIVHDARRYLARDLQAMTISAKVEQSAPWFRPILEYDEHFRPTEPWQICFRREIPRKAEVEPQTLAESTDLQANLLSYGRIYTELLSPQPPEIFLAWAVITHGNEVPDRQSFELWLSEFKRNGI